MKWLFLLVLFLIVFDIITGYAKAFKDGTIDSSIMREGFFHKGAEIASLVLAALLETAIEHVEMLDSITGFPLFEAAALYIITMELTSCMENLAELNPGLGKLFAPYLTKLQVHTADAIEAPKEKQAQGKENSPDDPSKLPDIGRGDGNE